MERLALTDQNAIELSKRLPWHRPDVQLLVVALDTASETKGGSAADAGTMDRIVGGPSD